MQLILLGQILAVVTAVRNRSVNVVKASAFRFIPKTKDQGYVDCDGSRHRTWNMPYLLDFRNFDGGYVAFGG
ncbi:hypothetical protein Tco_0303719 [Tanacetum coccineum]